MKTITITAALCLMAGSAVAKLPPLSDEAKAKAAETAAKTAHTGKVAAFQLCKSMNEVAETYLGEAKKSGKAMDPVPTPPCTDPGPFVYQPAPAPQPIEGAGAHSPPKTASTPPAAAEPAASAASR